VYAGDPATDNRAMIVAAFNKGLFVNGLPVATVKPENVMFLEIDPLGATDYEIALDLYLGDDSVVPVIIDVDAAKELAVALIEQATISTAA